MFRVYDTITGDVLEFEDVDEFNVSKAGWDDSAHEAIDGLCRSYKKGEYLGAFEAFLGIRVVTDDSLEREDIVDMYR